MTNRDEHSNGSSGPVADAADKAEIVFRPGDQGLPVSGGANNTATLPPIPFHLILPRTHRVLLAAFGLFLIAGFSLSVYLKPNPQGFGTHRSLGLPPCSIRLMFGIPCPSCGMTTSFSHFVRGEIPSSMRANAAGTALALVCLLMVPWALATAWKGRHFLIRHPTNVFAWLLTGLAIFTTLHWVWRMWLDGYLS